MNINYIEIHYKLHRDKYVKITGSRLGSLPRDLAEDIVQETYEKCFRNFDKFLGEQQDFENWFRKCLNNTFRDFQRLERDKGVCREIGEEDLVEEENDQIQFEDVKGIVPDKYAEVFRLYVFEGHTAKSISQIMKIGYAHARKMVSRCTQSIRKETKDGNDVLH